jgi:hypothetical protein
MAALTDFRVKNGLIVNENLVVNGTSNFSGAVTTGALTSNGNLTVVDSSVVFRGSSLSIRTTGNVDRVTLNASNGNVVAQGSITAGSFTTAGVINANGGTVDSNQATFNLLNTGVTTLNIGGESTAVSIGALTGTTTVRNNLTVTGNLVVQGTTTTVNTADLAVKDKNIELGVVETPTDTTADGGGITLKGATDKLIRWLQSNNSWTFSENIELESGKAYRVDGTEVLSKTSLGSGVTGSSLTSVGIITSGTWRGTVVEPTYGGTGVNNGNRTITLGGNLSTTGEFTLNLTTTSNTSLTLPSSGFVAVREDKLNVFASTSSAELAGVISDETGSGSLVFANSPALVTPNLGTPSSVNLANATNLPVSTGISGLGTGVATFLATPTSANLLTAVTDETGTGSLVFATNPSLTLPTIGGTGARFSGSTSGTVTLLAAATAGTTTITLPATTGTLVTTGDTGTVTSAMIANGTIVNEDISASANIAISKLAANTISGVQLGNNLNALTIGTGLSGGSYNGSGAVTIAIDSSVVTLTGTQTLTNKTLTNAALTLPTIGGTGAKFAGSGSGEITVVATAVAGTNTITLPAATGTVALSSNNLGFFSATTSAQLAGVLSDETGTGNVVFNTSPSFTTAINTGSASFNLLNTTATTINFGGAATTLTIGATTGSTTIRNNLTVAGNLVVQGTTTQVDSTVVTIDDPVLTLGGDTAPTVDDGKDRGIDFRWYDTQARLGFFGFRRSDNRFIVIPRATNTNEVFTGTLGDIQAANFYGALVGNADTATTASRWTNSRTITLGGDLTGNVSIDGSDNVTLNATIAANSVALGTDTTGNYVATIAAGDGISVSGSGSETAAVTIGIDSTVATLTGTQTLSNKTLTLPTIGGTGARFSGSTSGTITVLATATAGTNTITLPAATGTVALTSNIGDGTLTLSSNNGLTGSGTFSANQSGNGTVTFGLTGQALAFHNLATNGIVARTGAGTVAARTLTAGTGISITNGNGVDGNPTIANSGVTNLTGTANQISVTAATGDVTLSLPQNIHTGATPTFARLTLSQATGTAPFTVTSTTVVTNLNADLLDGQQGSFYLDTSSTAQTKSGNLTISGTFAANGGVTLGDASGDSLTINSSAISAPNGLNIASSLLVIDVANGRIGIGSSPTNKFDVFGGSASVPGVGRIRNISSTGNAPAEFRVENGKNTRVKLGVSDATGSVGTVDNNVFEIRLNDTPRITLNTDNSITLQDNTTVANGRTFTVGNYSVNGIVNNIETAGAADKLATTKYAVDGDNQVREEIALTSIAYSIAFGL